MDLHGFSRSDIRGARKMPCLPLANMSSFYRGTCHYRLWKGSRGGALSVTVGSCRCKQITVLRGPVLSLALLYHTVYYTLYRPPAYDLIRKPIHQTRSSRCRRKDLLAECHYRHSGGRPSASVSQDIRRMLPIVVVSHSWATPLRLVGLRACVRGWLTGRSHSLLFVLPNRTGRKRTAALIGRSSLVWPDQGLQDHPTRPGLFD
jgi:hypothetical protein